MKYRLPQSRGDGPQTIPEKFEPGSVKVEHPYDNSCVFVDYLGVAYVSGNIIGWHGTTYAFLSDVFVEEGLRKRGIGKALTERFINEAVTQKASTLISPVVSEGGLMVVTQALKKYSPIITEDASEDPITLDDALLLVSQGETVTVTADII